MNLKKIRQNHGKTQLEVSNAINITQFTYSNYENEKTEPNIETLKKLADYYDVSIDFLVGRPRPFDFPVVATDTQKALINHILQLDDSLCEKIDAYAYGLDDGKKDQQKAKDSLGGK